MHVILDVSRLLLSVHRPSPSGIDRVEMAYLRHWLARPARESSFVVQSPWGWFGAVERGRVAELAAALAELWQHGPEARPEAKGAAWRIAAGVQLGLAAGTGRSALRAALEGHRRPVFLLVSHRSLDREAPIAALRRAGAAFVPMVHDLIPLTHPEYSRPKQIARHGRRLASVAALADGVLANSGATAAALLSRFGPQAAALPPVLVAPLAIDARPARRAPVGAGSDPRPYFLCLGTIEPRKNHLLLLHLWREFAARWPDAGQAPRLVLVGRRGWENENILDLLDRCEALRADGLVTEAGAVPDSAALPLLAGARALLFPSFAEGYGLPLAEALARGVPAICSDLPALREVGGGVPDYLDPLDGAAWREAILDHARPDSPRRAAQLARLGSWRAPAWDAHFAGVEPFLARLAAGRVPAARHAPAAAALAAAAAGILRPARPAAAVADPAGAANAVPGLMADSARAA